MSESKSRRDYYQGRAKPWQEDWFGMFQNGPWASDADFDGTMSNTYDSYHPYSCNTCKRGGLQNLSLVRCSGCKVVKYCSKDHQKKDWTVHKKWCKAFAKVGDKRNDKIHHAEWYRRQNETNTMLMALMGDLRHSNFIQIATVQPHCRRCYRSGRNPDVDLLVCSRCNGVAVCQSCLGHQQPTCETLHNGDKEECQLYLIYLCCSGMIVEQGSPLLAASDTNCQQTLQPTDWNDYFQQKGNDFDTGVGLPITVLRFMAPIASFLTDGLTMPMTIQMVLAQLDLLKKSHLTIHILGADANEFMATRGFVELGRINPQLKRLDVRMVGPNLPNHRSYSYSDFVAPHEAPCHLEGTVEHVIGLYHTCSADTIPHLFVAFNPGFYDHTHFVHWKPTLELLQKRHGVPIAITGFNCLEVENDANILKTMGFQEIVAPTPNPFRSMRPFLDPAREETDFCYNNKAYAILQPSSGT